MTSSQDTEAAIVLHSLAVKVLKRQCWRQVFENFTLSTALLLVHVAQKSMHGDLYKIYKVWSARRDISSAECPTTEAKPLICFFSFDYNTSSLRCLHAAAVLLKKAQRARADLVWSTGAQVCEAAETDK